MRSEQDSQALQKAKEHFQAISQGLSSSADGQAQTLAEQLMGKQLAHFLPFIICLL